MPRDIPQHHLPTDEELMALPKDGHKYELLHGQIIRHAGWFEHGIVIAHFLHKFGNWYYANPERGDLLASCTGYRMSTGDVLCADFSFVSAARAQRGDSFFEGAPDLAVEVADANESNRYLSDKLELYFANGTRLAWIANMKHRTVSVHRNPTSADLLVEGDTLSGGDVAPDFNIAVAEIFDHDSLRSGI